jgi:hypothetical protein
MAGERSSTLKVIHSVVQNAFGATPSAILILLL